MDIMTAILGTEEERHGFWNGFLVVLPLYQAAMEQIFLREENSPVTTLVIPVSGLLCVRFVVV